MAGICATPIKGTHLRIVREDSCGVPVTGASSLVIVTRGFVQVQMEPDYEDGEELLERNASGEICVNEKDDPSLKRMTLTVDFCEVDPVAAAFVLGARLLDTAATPVTGTGFALAEGEAATRFSLEVWQRVAGVGACDPSGVQRYIYNAWPHVGNARIGTYTIENGRSTLQFVAETFAASTLWGSGPGTGTSWLPAGEVVEVGEHWLWNIATTEPPTPDCGPQSLT